MHDYHKPIELTRLVRKTQYIYGTEIFDSAPELAIYIYAIDHNIPVTREPMSFTYYYNDKEHMYIPDFLYDNKLVEIKGDHFFKADGTMCNPYNHDQDGLYEAKHQCGLVNNVIF